MTTASLIYAEVRATIDHPINVVWAPIASFGGLEHWALGVIGCTVEGEGIGSVRTVMLEGRGVCEQLDQFDPIAHRIRYQILQPHSVPAEDVFGEIYLTKVGKDRTDMIWRSGASKLHAPREQLAARIEGFYNGSIEGLKRLLDAT